MTKILQHIALFLIGITLIVASGGSGKKKKDDSGSTPTPPPVTKLTGTLALIAKGSTVTVNDVSYSTSAASTGSKSDLATENSGQFTYVAGESITFTINGIDYTVIAKEKIMFSDLIRNVDKANNLKQIVLYLDTDNADNTVTLGEDTAATLDPNLSREEFIKAFNKLTGSDPEPLFTPSLGINLEAPQAESSLAGQPMPFVDIYRTARPFLDRNSSSNATVVSVDDNGWPTEVTDGSALTKILQGAISGSIPSGNYSLIYEGSGHIGFSSNITHHALPSDLLTDHTELKGRLIEVAETPETINLVINNDQIDVKNIRIIMPGGTCKNNTTQQYNHTIHVYSQDDCAAGFSYVTFVDRLIANRNEIIFNPEYLAFLKNFKSLRMMNFMEATPGISTCKNDGILDQDCIQSDHTNGELSQWESRAKIDHASWGGSSNTPTEQRKGVPIEVIVELANQTMTNPWFTMPHYADDDYVTQFASYINEHLNSQLKVYLEYSNEASWNPGFVAFYYTQAKGIEAGYDSIPDEFSNLSNNSRDKNYFARLRYYAQRSIEIFDLWTEAGFSSSRLIRVAGSFQGDTVLSKQILNHNNGEHFDVLAIAPYFYGCSKRVGSCADTETINKVLSEVTTVDEIFEVIDDPDAPNALANTIQKISNHAAIARSAGVKLTTYEGGQHLTTTLAGIGDLSEGEKARLRGLFQDANRDPRMKDRYISLLNAWKAADNTALFNLYTLPQSYYRYGNWGIKEHLGQSRTDAPKFDAAMTFQETVGVCWWSDCSAAD